MVKPVVEKVTCVLALAGFAHSADIDWTACLGTCVDTPISVSTDESINFVNVGGHNVFLFDDKAAYDSCNFNAAVQISSETYSSSSTGTFYFGCEKGTHCNGGQKITVTVTSGGGGGGPEPTPAPETPEPTPAPDTPEPTPATCTNPESCKDLPCCTDSTCVKTGKGRTATYTCEAGGEAPPPDGGACTLLASGEQCTAGSDCCSGTCKANRKTGISTCR